MTILHAVPTPPVSPRQRRYSMEVVRVAKEMDAGGWTATQIARYFKRTRNLEVHRNTVRRWVDPGYDEMHRASNMASYRRHQEQRSRAKPPPVLTAPVEDRLDRLRDLRGAGLSLASTALVMNLDYGLGLDAGQVRHLTNYEGRLTRKSLRNLGVLEEELAA